MKSSNLKKAESLVDPCAKIDRKKAHDLRAQVINIKGFSNELSKSVEDIQCLLDSTEISTAVVDRVMEILVQDMLPCLNFIEMSSSKLDECIDTFSDK